MSHVSVVPAHRAFRTQIHTTTGKLSGVFILYPQPEYFLSKTRLKTYSTTFLKTLMMLILCF